jgi:hypothetical protein
MLIILGPQLMGRVTVKELSEDYGEYLGCDMTIRGNVESVRPYPFSIGENVDNHVLTLVDGDAAVSMIFDRNKLSFDLQPGDPVIVKCAFTDYNEDTILLARKVTPARR